jgi:hypothetical protein
MTTRLRFIALIAPAVLAFAGFSMAEVALADTVIHASDNATIQPGGPRTGTNGKVFFNAEGSSNNTFASFGVADFQTPAGVTFAAGETLSLTLTQSNASFTHNGGLLFYLSSDTTTSLQPGTSPLSFNASALPAGLGSQLATTYLLGTGIFTEVADGHADVFSFTPTGAALAYLTTEIDTAGVIRLIMAPGDGTVSATYAGFSNTTPSTPGPELTLSGVGIPEPSTLVLGAVGLLVVVQRRKRIDPGRAARGDPAGQKRDGCRAAVSRP